MKKQNSEAYLFIMSNNLFLIAEFVGVFLDDYFRGITDDGSHCVTLAHLLFAAKTCSYEDHQSSTDSNSST